MNPRAVFGHRSDIMFTRASEHRSFFNEAFEVPFVFSACAVVATPFKHGNINDLVLGKKICADCGDTGSLRHHVHPRVRALLSLRSRRAQTLAAD